MATPVEASAFAIEAGSRPLPSSRFIGYLVLAGLINAAIAALLFFNLPASRDPTTDSLLVRSILAVTGAILAGLAGSRFYWNRSAAALRAGVLLPFRRFAYVNAEAWVWVPAIILLSRQDSPISTFLSALGAALLSNGLRRAIPRFAGSTNQPLTTTELEEDEMFAATLRTPHRESQGYVIAFSLYLTGYLLIKHFNLTAGVPLALAAFLVVWHLTPEPDSAAISARTDKRSARRLASAAAAAVLVTLFALLFGVARRNRAEEAASVARTRDGGEVNRPISKGSGTSLVPGFESVILLPAPEKEKIVAPQPVNISPFANRTAKPLVIHFDGAYWYFQPPEKRPGPNAHRTNGSPLTADIGTNNFFPLTMEAVQRLATAIRLAPYREIQMTVENRDNIAGPIVLSVVLSDSGAPGKPSLSLGGEPVVSSEPSQFTLKSAPAQEVLSFYIPEHATIREFDEVTVFFLPDVAHFEVGPKIAIQQFVLVPR